VAAQSANTVWGQVFEALGFIALLVGLEQLLVKEWWRGGVLMALGPMFYLAGLKLTKIATTSYAGVGGKGGDAKATEEGRAFGGKGGAGGPPGGRGGDGGGAEAHGNATAIGGEGGGGDGRGGRSGIEKATGWDLDMVLPDGRRLRDVGHGGAAAVLGGPGIGGAGGGARSGNMADAPADPTKPAAQK
jgi:hypothetical protein